jgi:hypothetical protein
MMNNNCPFTAKFVRLGRKRFSSATKSFVFIAVALSPLLERCSHLAAAERAAGFPEYEPEKV